MTTLLSASDIYAGYSRKPVIKNVSLTVAPGEWLGLLGPNGSGKTTLLRCLAGLLQPACGQISLEGENLTQIRPRHRARKMAVTPQNPLRPPGLDVLAYILLGRYPWLAWSGLYSETDYSMARQALSQTGLEHLTERKLETLSGGEWQRAAIARALAQLQGENRAILLLDEATASMDPAHAIEMLELMEKLRQKGMAIIMAIHDCNLAAIYCTHLLGLKDGSKLFYGSAADVFTEKNLGDLYDTAFGIFTHPDIGAPQAFIHFSHAPGSRLPAGIPGGC